MIDSGVRGQREEPPPPKTKAPEKPDIADLGAFARSLGYRYEETEEHKVCVVTYSGGNYRLGQIRPPKNTVLVGSKMWHFEII